MGDQALASALVLTEKGAARAYALAELESSHEEGREFLRTLLAEAQAMHARVFDFARERGWYSVPPATAGMVQQAQQAWLGLVAGLPDGERQGAQGQGTDGGGPEHPGPGPVR